MNYETNYDALEHVDQPDRATKAIHRIKGSGGPVTVLLGDETGPLGTWFNIYHDGEHVAALDYFGEPEHEGVTHYIHPDWL